jgi:hypothetical protein
MIADTRLINYGRRRFIAFKKRHPLYPQMLALTSPTGGGRSVGIVRLRTEAMELLLVYYPSKYLGTWIP